MKKRMIAGLMAVLMTMSLAACGSSAGSSDASGTGSAATGDNSAAQAASGDKVTLSLCWWGNQTRNDVTKKAVDLYMEQNPNVEIKVEFTDWSGYWDKLSAMAAGGNLPDIIQMDYSYLQQYQQSGQLAPVYFLSLLSFFYFFPHIRITGMFYNYSNPIILFFHHYIGTLLHNTGTALRFSLSLYYATI